MVSNFHRVSTFVHHTSYFHQGNKTVKKHNNLPKSAPPLSLSSDLSSSSCVGPVEENLCVSSRLPGGKTMKKLLADEMKKESEAGRRPPSIIANLMGLEWLPAQQNASKQNKRLSDDYTRKCNSDGFVRSGKSNDSRSQRKHGKGQQKGGNVYEVIERSNIETGSVASRAGSCRNGSDDDDVAFVRQKFIDAKRFSTDEKLKHSKEFYDALEVLDSNKDLLLKFLQEPNSLFTKHLHHLHGARENQYRRVEGLKSSNTLRCNVDGIGYHSGGESSEKIDITRSRSGGNERHFNAYSTHNVGSRKLGLSEEKDASSIATRIVVLKPNLCKARNTVRSVSPASPSCDRISNDEFHIGRSNKMLLGSELMGKRSKHNDLDFCGKSRESRELARDITRKMKDRSRVDAFNVSSYGYKGYSADESSSEENNSSYESEVTNLGSASSLSRGTQNKASASPLIESSINREAKRRLSRRWKMTHKSQEVEASVKGSTLAEMLAIPDVDLRPCNIDYVAARDERLQNSVKDGGTTDSTTPFGISSRDGWKDGNVWKSSRSKSLSASSSQHGNPKSSRRHEPITSERFLVRSRSFDSGKNKSFKRDSERIDGSFSESTWSGNKEYQSTCVNIVDDMDVSSSVNMVMNSIDGKASPDVKSVIIASPDVKSVIIETVSCEHVPPVNAVADAEHKSVSESQKCPDELVSAPTVQSSVLSHDGRYNYDTSFEQQEPSSNYDVESSSGLQFSATQAKSPASNKESEQPSPVSVLEAPFVEDVSSESECFERVSAELHGLRMQLQLLKQESEVYDEGSILVSSDECEESTELDNDKAHHFVGESWEPSYFLDVLTYSGIDETNLDVFLETWHSPICPVGPWLFDNLEKKYGKWNPCLRSERKLLFDRINAGILEIFSQYIDVGPWLKPLRTISHQRWKNGLKTELHYLLENRGKVAIENMMDAAILGEMQWFKLGDHLDVVVSDIEQSLIDQLATEFLS